MVLLVQTCGLYELYVEKQTTVMASVKNKAQKIALGEQLIDKNEQVRLFIAIADREHDQQNTEGHSVAGYLFFFYALFLLPCNWIVVAE